MSLGLEIYKSKNVSIYENGISYKSLFKAAQTILFCDVKEMTAVYVADGNLEDFDLSLFDSKWHNIKLGSFKREDRFEILKTMHRKLTPIILPKHIEGFEKGNDVNLGLLSVNKNIGIIRTNNIKREIKWDVIDLFEYWLNDKGVGQARIKFTNEIFEFSFKIGSIKQHTLLIEIMKLMIGTGKVIDKTKYSETI